MDTETLAVLFIIAAAIAGLIYWTYITFNRKEENPVFENTDTDTNTNSDVSIISDFELVDAEDADTISVEHQDEVPQTQSVQIDLSNLK